MKDILPEHDLNYHIMNQDLMSSLTHNWKVQQLQIHEESRKYEHRCSSTSDQYTK